MNLDQAIEHGLEIDAGSVIVRPMTTTSQATDLYLGDLERRGYSQRTIQTYRRILYKLADKLPDDYDVARITVDDCRRFLDQWNRNAAGTRAHTFAVVSAFFDWLTMNEKIKRSPLTTLARPKRTRAADLDVTTVTTDDVQLLLAAARTWTEKLAIAIPAYSGPRRKAVAALRLSDYDRRPDGKSMMRFREKGGKTIWKPVPDELEALLEAAIADGAIVELDDYLVPPEGVLQRKGVRDDRVIWRVVKRVADRAGVKTHVHALRAAFAVFYLESFPGDTYGLKEHLGHESFVTTEVYLRKLDKGAAMEKVRTLSWLGAPAVSDRAELAQLRAQVAALESRIAAGEAANTGFAASSVMEAGGFEPPLRDKPLPERAVSQQAAESLDAALVDEARASLLLVPEEAT